MVSNEGADGEDWTSGGQGEELYHDDLFLVRERAFKRDRTLTLHIMAKPAPRGRLARDEKWIAQARGSGAKVEPWSNVTMSDI